jgi:hypothetical protein
VGSGSCGVRLGVRPGLLSSCGVRQLWGEFRVRPGLLSNSGVRQVLRLRSCGVRQVL